MRISVWSSDVCSSDLGLKVALVPRNRPNLRRNRGHVLYPDAASKWAAVAEAVRTVREGEAMRPVLVGTRSVGDSEAVAAALERIGIACRILNARQDSQEAEIVAAAGEVGAVTVATHMAGRGTDLELSDAAHAAKIGSSHV